MHLPSGTNPFWGADLAWNSCHEVSASTGEGVEEVFRVITRRLVEQRNLRTAFEQRLLAAQFGPGSEGARTPAGEGSGEYFYDSDRGHGGPYGVGGGSFRVGVGDKRRSWLGIPQYPIGGDADTGEVEGPRVRRGGCC